MAAGRFSDSKTNASPTLSNISGPGSKWAPHRDTQLSLAQVNKIHAGIWKKMPGNFSRIDDFIYTMCWIGADMHRLRQRIGLPGFTRNQQIASHRFWYEISKMFASEVGPVDHEFPPDFDGMLDFMTRYEAVDWEYSPEGGQTCEALLQQFSRRWFPAGLRWAGRTMILSLLDEPARRVHRLSQPHPLVVRLNEWGMKLVLLTQEHILPDPKISTPERHRLQTTNSSTRRLCPEVR